MIEVSNPVIQWNISQTIANRLYSRLSMSHITPTSKKPQALFFSLQSSITTLITITPLEVVSCSKEPWFLICVGPEKNILNLNLTIATSIARALIWLSDLSSKSLGDIQQLIYFILESRQKRLDYLNRQLQWLMSLRSINVSINIS